MDIPVNSVIPSKHDVALPRMHKTPSNFNSKGTARQPLESDELHLYPVLVQ